MKTREELFIEFQREFETDVNWSIWAIFLISFLITAISSAVGFQYLGYKVILFFIIAFISISILLTLMTLIPSEEVIYPIKKMKERVLIKKYRLIKEKDTIEDKLTKAKEDELIARDLVAWMENPELTKSIKNFDIASAALYIYGNLKIAEEKVAKCQKNLHKLENQIYEFEVKLEFYDQITEKTFYQYFWSFKWLKKIN